MVTSRCLYSSPSFIDYSHIFSGLDVLHKPTVGQSSQSSSHDLSEHCLATVWQAKLITKEV